MRVVATRLEIIYFANGASLHHHSRDGTGGWPTFTVERDWQVNAGRGCGPWGHGVPSYITAAPPLAAKLTSCFVGGLRSYGLESFCYPPSYLTTFLPIDRGISSSIKVRGQKIVQGEGQSFSTCRAGGSIFAWCHGATHYNLISPTLRNTFPFALLLIQVIYGSTKDGGIPPIPIHGLY